MRSSTRSPPCTTMRSSRPMRPGSRRASGAPKCSSARALHLEGHQFAPGGRQPGGGQVFVGDAMPAQVFLGQVDAVLVPVEAHVLPEIDQLQAGADGVGLFQVLRAGGVEQMQHQPADRIGRARAVVQQRGVILVARDGDVLFEGRQQVVERRDRQLVARDGGRQRPEDPRQRRIAGAGVAPGSAPMRCSSARKAASCCCRSASLAGPSSAISSAARANR